VAFATPDAACTFDDDLDAVAEMGIQVVSDDEALQLSEAGAKLVFLGDLSLGQVLQTLAAFGVHISLSGLAVAVFDHGAAPPGFSDRIFRFNFLRERLATGLGLPAFGFQRERIPASMTRLQAVASSAPGDLPLFVMDTAPAAILGALEDPKVRRADNAVIANVGNFHCLAFHLYEDRVAGLFEHHTGELTASHLGEYVGQLANGTISNDVVYADKGHGALVVNPGAPLPELLAVTGPRRALLVESGLKPYLAVPHGDMMLAGNFGLLRAYASHDSAVREAVDFRLGTIPASSLTGSGSVLH
jgi:uncharacterized protein (DUF1786 family)